MKIKNVLCAVAFLPLVLVSAYADQAGVNTVKGWMIAGIVDEKCTGNVDPDDIQLYVQAFRKIGISAEDIQRGFAEGINYAESQYPGHTKPPRAECARASKVFNAGKGLLAR